MSNPTTLIDVLHDTIVASVGLLGAWIGGHYAVRVARMSLADQHISEHRRWKRDALQEIGLDFSRLAVQRIGRVHSHKMLYSQVSTQADKDLAISQLNQEPIPIEAFKQIRNLEERAKLISEKSLATKINRFNTLSNGPKWLEEMTAEDFDAQNLDLEVAKNVVTEEVAALLETPG